MVVIITHITTLSWTKTFCWPLSSNRPYHKTWTSAPSSHWESDSACVIVLVHRLLQVSWVNSRRTWRLVVVGSQRWPWWNSAPKTKKFLHENFAKCEATDLGTFRLAGYAGWASITYFSFFGISGLTCNFIIKKKKVSCALRSSLTFLGCHPWFGAQTLRRFWDWMR